MTGPAPEPGSTFVEDILDDETQPTETPEGQPPGTAVVPGESPLPSVQPAPEGQPPAEQPEGAPPAEPVPPSTPPGESAAPSPSTAVATQPSYPAWTYRAGGEDYEFPGSLRGQDGAFFPNTALPELSRLVSLGTYHEHGWQQELAERDRAVEARVQAAEERGQMGDAVLAAFDRLRQQGPEAMAKWLDELERNWPLLMANAKTQVLEARVKAAEAVQAEIQEAREAEALTPRLEETLWGQVEAICAQPQAKGLDPRAFYQRLVSDFLDQIFFEAPQDDPHHGIRKGEILVNYDVILRQAEYEVGLLQRAGAAARANAAVMGRSGAPPTVTAGGRSAPGVERKAPPKFKTQQEYFDWLETAEGKAYYSLVGQG